MGRVIVFVGPTGAGKSVQARRLADKLGFAYISTGDLLRASKDPKIKRLLEEGAIAKPADIEAIIEPELDKLGDGQGVILDGCMRVLSEAEWLDRYIERQGGGPLTALLLNVDKEVAMKRLLERRRHDDTPKLIERRWQNYLKITMPAVQYYRDRGVLAEIDGNGTIEEVASRVEAAV